MSSNRRRPASNSSDAPPTNRARIDNGLNILPAANNINNNNNFPNNNLPSNNNNLPNNNNNLLNNNNNNLPNNNIDLEAIIAAERARANIVEMPPAAMLLPLIDIRNRMTSSNYAFAGWRTNHVFNSLTGLVQFVHRGATLRRSFDRCDVRVSFGFGTDTQTVGIYAYDQCAAILETARVNEICTFTALTVVEQGDNRGRWTGTVPFVLRFTRASAFAITGTNNNNVNNNNNNNLQHAPADNNNNIPIGNIVNQREMPGTNSGAANNVLPIGNMAMQREMQGTSSSSSSTNNVVAAPVPRGSQTNARANRERATDQRG